MTSPPKPALRPTAMISWLEDEAEKSTDPMEAEWLFRAARVLRRRYPGLDKCRH